MRVVVALGGNALLRRGQAPTVANERANVRVACAALVPLASAHELVVAHGSGPQVGLLALQSAAVGGVEQAPLDVLDAQSEGLVGYLIEQELRSRLPVGRSVATLLTMVEVDPGDPAFDAPTKPIGPLYERAAAETLGRERGWVVRRDGNGYRRVVASPVPRRIVDLEPVRLLLEHGCVVVCAGGGGIPVARTGGHGRVLEGVEAVVDKDHASALLARELGADALLIATDVDAVYLDWGGHSPRPIRRAAPEALRELALDAGSMGPKVEAACAFAAAGGFAAIGSLDSLEQMLCGEAGTLVTPAASGIEAAGAR